MDLKQSRKLEMSLKQDVKDRFTKEQFQALFKINIFNTLKDAFLILTFFLLNYFAIILLHQQNQQALFYLAPLLMLVNAIIFNWINVQVHEASHKLLFESKKLNDLFCDLVLGAWALHDVGTYRSTHLDHHNKLHSDDDPDKDVYTDFTGSYSRLILGFFSDALSLTAIKRVLKVFKLNKKVEKKWHTAFFKLLAQCILLSTLIYFTGVWGFVYYILFQLLPLFCIFPILMRIRTVVQHYSEKLEKDNLWISRTTVSSLLEHIVIGARMDYHFEHHLFPAIPYYNLRVMHNKLIEFDFFKQKNNYRTNRYYNEYLKLAS